MSQSGANHSLGFKFPGRERDRGAQRFEVTGRNVDYEAVDLAETAGLELGGHHGNVPVVEKLGVWIQLEKTAVHKEWKSSRRAA
jgi:hypothetical protein